LLQARVLVLGRDNAGVAEQHASLPQGSGYLFVHECPHKLELITKIEDGLNAYRV
jgi:hypothetical protein